MKEMLTRFHLNGDTAGFCSEIQKSVQHNDSTKRAVAFSAEACINGYETERRLSQGCDGSGR